MEKKMPKWIWAIIIPSVLAVGLSILILTVGITGYMKSYSMPEGYTRSHHSYEDALEFAKTLDANATVSENYSDRNLSNDHSIREWPATINGIDCVIASTPETFYDSRGSAYTRTLYALDTDYDQVVMGMVLEDYPELGELKDNRYGYSMNAISADDTDNSDANVKEHPRSSVYSTVNLDSIDEEAFDKLWDSYVKAYQEYASYDPTREYSLIIVIPTETVSFRNTGEDQYQSAKEILFS